MKKGAPDEVVTKLTAAYAEGAKNENFVKQMAARGFVVENLSGDAAQAFLSNWQSVTTWLLADAGLAKTSPQEFRIPRP